MKKINETCQKGNYLFTQKGRVNFMYQVKQKNVTFLSKPFIEKGHQRFGNTLKICDKTIPILTI